MSILGAESYVAVHQLVTDVKVLSKEERNHVLWYACDGGDLSMVKSVIRAGCDVDHFHRSHTPLMMASIRGHDEVVKELILAGCKVDLSSSKCFVGWLRFITKMASAWRALLVWAVVTVFMIATNNVWVEMVCIWLLMFTLTLHFLNKEAFKVSRMLRIKTRIRYIAWALIVPAMALVWSVLGTAVSEAQLQPATTLVVKVTGALILLMSAIGIGILAVVQGVARAGSGTGAVAVAGVLAAVIALTAVDEVKAVLAECVSVIGTWIGGESGAVEEKIVYAFVGPGTVGKVVAVTLILELVLTVAMVDAGAVPFAVAMTVTGTVIAAGIGELAVQGTVLKSVSVPKALMLPVIVLLALTPIGVIRRIGTSSNTGMTALHYAAWYDHITCGTHLVEAGASMRAKSRYFKTPLHICSRRFRATVQQVQSRPLKQVIAVIGNTECGKSTLIAALQSESRTILQSFVCISAQVCNITHRTAGIETVSFSSAVYGEVLFYDFAGQSDYHGPHQPFLEAVLSKPGVSVAVILLVKVTEGRAVITQQLIRWLQPVVLTSTPSTPYVTVVGSFLNQAKSKKEAQQKLQGCIDSVQNEYPTLKVQELFLLDCREPASPGIQELRRYLEQTQPIRSTLSTLLYNVHWIMAQLQKTFSEQSIQLSTFRTWLQDNAHILPSHLPSPENVCQDLSAAGYILFLCNKQDMSQSWLVLDLHNILNNVYGTLFSPSRVEVNQFGLLHCTHLSRWFPMLDPKMVQEVLITLEFCIRVDPLLIKEELMLSLTEHDEGEGWLYFPALVSAKTHQVFTPHQQCLHWACWELKTDVNHSISAHLLQSILLDLAATHVFIEEELPCSVRKHCCSVWVNGLSWGSTTGVDVVVQISNSSVVQVISRSREGPGELYRYMSTVTQSIFNTIAKLSPALKVTPHIIHPYICSDLDESIPTTPNTQYPVASIIRSIEAGHKYVHSLPTSSGIGSSRANLQELFGGWSPCLTVVQCLKKTQKDLSE